MRFLLVALPALACAGLAAAQDARRPDPRDPRSRVAPVEYRSAFEGYRPFAEAQLADWRKSNETVAKPPAGKPGPTGHGGHK